MALKAIIDAAGHAALPEAVQAEYTDSGDGKFKLDVTPVGGLALEDVGGLKRAKESEKTARVEAERKLKAYQNDDGELLDPEAARTAIAAVADGGDDNVEARIAEAVATRERDLNNKHTKVVEGLTSDRDAAVNQAKSLLIDASASAALGKHKGKSAILMPHIKNRSRVVVDSEGNFTLEVLDDAGTPLSGSGPNGNMTMDEFVGGLREDEDWGVAFEGSGSKGSGSTSADTKGTRTSTSQGVERVTRRQAEMEPDIMQKVADGSAVIVDGD